MSLASFGSSVRVAPTTESSPKAVICLRVIPEELGFGPLSRKELKDTAAELSGNQAALIMVGEPTLDKAFDEAVSRAAKTVKQTVDTTTDELARELKGAVAS